MFDQWRSDPDDKTIECVERLDTRRRKVSSGNIYPVFNTIPALPNAFLASLAILESAGQAASCRYSPVRWISLFKELFTFTNHRASNSANPHGCAHQLGSFRKNSLARYPASKNHLLRHRAIRPGFVSHFPLPANQIPQSTTPPPARLASFSRFARNSPWPIVEKSHFASPAPRGMRRRACSTG